MPGTDTEHDTTTGSGLGRRDFLTLAGGGIAGSLCGGCQTAGKRQPNVVLIFADDLGYGDVCGYSCQGSSTPNIDSIAANGVLFTDGHVTAPVCSPSRAGLLTGRYQQRFGHEFNAGGAARCEREGLGLPTSETTVADAMRAAGYATGLVGKWHLGSQPQFQPQQRGFDEYFGFLHGANTYMEPPRGPGIHYAARANENYKDKRSEFHQIYRGTNTVQEKEYLTDAFSREAVDFIDRHHEDPFFLYLAYNAPHTPLQVTSKYYERFPHIADEKQRIFAAMVSAMDDGIGRVLETLKQNNLWDDTLVLFVSDNGCATYTEACYNDPLLGGKLMMFEGGQRVPFMAQYPGRLPAGKVYDGAVSALDIFPTAVALAGAQAPDNCDGVDLMPYLTGEREGDPHQALFWRNGANSAVRQGNWKLVNLTEGRNLLLYDLAADIGEMNDLAAKHPEKLKELSGLLADWNSELVEPLWPSKSVIPLEVEGHKFDIYV